jgi:hypothetical protein
VDDLLVVHVLQRLRRLAHVGDRVLERQSRSAALHQQPAEIDALDEVHHQVLAAVVLEVVDDPHHPWMAQLGEQARLDLEARGVPPVEQALECHVPLVALGVAGAVDRAHRAARDGQDHLVALAHNGARGQLNRRKAVRHPSEGIGQRGDRSGSPSVAMG